MKNEEHGSSRDHALAVSPSATTERELESFYAFKLGFMEGFSQSGEGWNGEYPRADTVAAWLDETSSGYAHHCITKERASELLNAEQARQLSRKLAALVAEEQVAGSWSREANETDWKARCEAAEQALEGMRKTLRIEADTFFICEQCGHQHDRHVETLDVYFLLSNALDRALNPTPQGGKPDSEPGIVVGYNFDKPPEEADAMFTRAVSEEG